MTTAPRIASTLTRLDGAIRNSSEPKGPRLASSYFWSVCTELDGPWRQSLTLLSLGGITENTHLVSASRIAIHFNCPIHDATGYTSAASAPADSTATTAFGETQAGLLDSRRDREETAFARHHLILQLEKPRQGLSEHDISSIPAEVHAPATLTHPSRSFRKSPIQGQERGRL